MLTNRFGLMVFVALSVASRASAEQTELSMASALTPDARYVFSVDPCKLEYSYTTCDYYVRLMRGAAVLGEAQLSSQSTADPPVRVDASELSWIGDPLGEVSGWFAWRAGSGQDEVTIAAKLVRLSAQREGLVLRRNSRGGTVEALVVRSADTLTTTWLDGYWSLIEVAHSEDGTDRLLLFNGLKVHRGFRWMAEARWDEQTQALKFETRRDPHAFLAIVGPYASLEEADAAEDCLPGGMRVSTMPYLGMPKGPYVIASLSSDAKLAEAALAEATCSTDKQRALLPLRYRQVSRGEYALGDGAVATLSIGRFDGEGWPLLVNVRTAEGAQQRLSVLWSANMPFLMPTAEMAARGLDYPPPFQGPGWIVGDGYKGHATLAVQRVHLGDQRFGLLLSMRAGFEHVSHRHALVALQHGKLREVWTAEDGFGSLSALSVRPTEQGSDEVLQVTTDSGESGVKPSVEVTRVSYDASKGKWVTAALGCDPGVHVLIYRRFAMRALAEKAQDERCKDDRGWLDGWAFKASRTVGGTGFILARDGVDRSALEAASAEATACRPELQPELTTWCPAAKKR